MCKLHSLVCSLALFVPITLGSNTRAHPLNPRQAAPSSSSSTSAWTTMPTRRPQQRAATARGTRRGEVRRRLMSAHLADHPGSLVIQLATQGCLPACIGAAVLQLPVCYLPCCCHPQASCTLSSLRRPRCTSASPSSRPRVRAAGTPRATLPVSCMSAQAGMQIAGRCAASDAAAEPTHSPDVCMPAVSSCCRCAGLHLSRDGSGGKMRVKATGGGAYKFAEVGSTLSFKTATDPAAWPASHAWAAGWMPLPLNFVSPPPCRSCSRSGWG